MSRRREWPIDASRMKNIGVQDKLLGGGYGVNMSRLRVDKALKVPNANANGLGRGLDTR